MHRYQKHGNVCREIGTEARLVAKSRGGGGKLLREITSRKLRRYEALSVLNRFNANVFTYSKFSFH